MTKSQPQERGGPRTIATERTDNPVDCDTFKRLRSIIANQFGIDRSKVALAASLVDDLEANSLDEIELIMAFEDAFDIMIPDSAAASIVTIQDAVDYIEQLKNRRRPEVSHP